MTNPFVVPSREALRTHPVGRTDTDSEVLAFLKSIDRDSVFWTKPSLFRALFWELDEIPRWVRSKYPQVLARTEVNRKDSADESKHTEEVAWWEDPAHTEARARFTTMLFSKLIGEYVDAYTVPAEKLTATQLNILQTPFWYFCYNRFHDHIQNEARTQSKRADTLAKPGVETLLMPALPVGREVRLSDWAKPIEAMIRKTSKFSVDKHLAVFHLHLDDVFDTEVIAARLGATLDQAKCWKTAVKKICVAVIKEGDQ